MGTNLYQGWAGQCQDLKEVLFSIVQFPGLYVVSEFSRPPLQECVLDVDLRKQSREIAVEN